MAHNKCYPIREVEKSGFKEFSKAIFGNINSNIEKILEEMKGDSEVNKYKQVPSVVAANLVEAIKKCRKNFKLKEEIPTLVDSVLAETPHDQKSPLTFLPSSLVFKVKLLDAKTQTTLKTCAFVARREITFPSFAEKIMRKYNIEDKSSFELFYTHNDLTLSIKNEEDFKNFLTTVGKRKAKNKRLSLGNLMETLVFTVFLETVFDPLNTLERSEGMEGFNEIKLPKSYLINSEGRKGSAVGFLHFIEEEETQRRKNSAGTVENVVQSVPEDVAPKVLNDSILGETMSHRAPSFPSCSKAEESKGKAVGFLEFADEESKAFWEQKQPEIEFSMLQKKPVEVADSKMVRKKMRSSEETSKRSSVNSETAKKTFSVPKLARLPENTRKDSPSALHKTRVPKIRNPPYEMQLIYEGGPESGRSESEEKSESTEEDKKSPMHALSLNGKKSFDLKRHSQLSPNEEASKKKITSTIESWLN